MRMTLSRAVAPYLVASYRGSIARFLLSLAIVCPGAAWADFPPVQSFIAFANNPFRCASGMTLSTTGTCEVYPTRQEACQALVVAYDNHWATPDGCPPGTLAACLDTPPSSNNVTATFYLEQVVPFVCHAGTFTIGQTQASGAPACPAHSPPGSSCTCNSGFAQALNVCSGGKNNGPSCPSCGNPANPANGNKYERQSVYRGLNGFELSLAFNTYDDYPTRFGRRWRDSFDRRVSVDGGNVVTFRPDGKVLLYTPVGGSWVPDADTNDRLIELQNPPGTRTGWQLHVAAGDELETYDASGKLLAITSRAGLTQTFTYSDGTGGPNGGFVLDANLQPTVAPLPVGLLIRASDSFGRVLAFAYDTGSHVVTIVDPSGQTYRFSYGTINRNLTSITFPDGTARGYVYNEPANTGGANLANALTGIVDENGARFATFQYDTQERAVSTEHAGGVFRHTLSYAGGTTTVTDPLGTPRNYGFQVTLDAFKNTGIAGPACPGCGPAAQSFDANGNVASRTDWNGNVTFYGYDLARNLETSRTEAFGTAQARTISTVWHPNFRLPVRVAEPLRITSYLYNGDGVSCGVMVGSATLVPGVPCAKTMQPTSDATGAAGLDATPIGGPRTWTYTYNANGSVLTLDGPRTDVADVTAYAYYANDDADPGRRGNLAAIANALGHTTQILAYNAHGQPTTIVDPNGLTTTLAYDSGQRLTSRNVGGEVTIYTYDGVGQFTRVTLPDGSFVAYGYDAAHRLTLVQDNLGNRIAYTLDAMGNRLADQVLDPGGALAQARSRVYDGLNRLFQDIGAQAQTTQYAYDSQGNVTGVTDPLGRVIVNAYDALNRLVRVTDPGNGQTQYAYNGIDQPVAVSDPRGLATIYSYDGLVNLNAQSSPDTGATVSTYDAAGNLLTQTDAKGQTTSYAYDALNRVTSITFADGSKQSYGYDQGSNGLGRLTFFTESNPQNQIAILHDYAYDAHGRAIVENRSMNGVTYAMHYGYDAAGRLSGVTYPSGRTIAYDFDALGRVSQVSTTPPPASGGATQIVVSNVAYQPFGGVKGFTLGSGQSYSRGYDQDGRIAGYGFGNQLFTLGYDAAGRIVSIADAANVANSNTYGYDSLDRLTSALRATASFGYTYDAVGNRTSKTAGSASDTYTYSATSNRIASIAGASSRSFAFDANGSTLSDGANQYAYDARGRMVQASNTASGATAYQVNALGQRVRKTNSTDDRVFLYDTRGRLIGESTPSGVPLREYLWLNDQPVAVAVSPTPGTQCPATPTRDRSGTFIPFDVRERIEAKAGRPGPRGWEWALGPGVGTAGAFVQTDLDWVSGKLYGYRLVYETGGSASLEVRDGAALVASATWSGAVPMRSGNAVRLVLRIDDQGPDSRAVLTIDSVDGQAIGERIVVRGSDTLDADAGRRIYAGLSLKDGFTIEGTLRLVYPVETVPTQREVSLRVAAGNVECATTIQTAAALYYIHTDHLNTPRFVADGNGITVWRWDQQEPFGATPPNGDPDGDGVKFDLPLRFPGQYTDRETNLAYNLMRDYDPFIGRYAESDPFGLRGSLNTYAYVGGSPLGSTDPAGEISPAAVIGVTAAIGAVSAGTGAAIQGGSANQIGTAAAIGGLVGAASGLVTVVGTAGLTPGTALGVSMGISAITGTTSNIVGQIATNPLAPIDKCSALGAAFGGAAGTLTTWLYLGGTGLAGASTVAGAAAAAATSIPARSSTPGNFWRMCGCP